MASLPFALPLNDTPWNQHHGVGSTLLANWVEERTVGPERILKERDVKLVSQRGHADILAPSQSTLANSDSHPDKLTTVARESYKAPAQSTHPLQSGTGKLKTMQERDWLAQTIEQSQRPTCPSPDIYQSTTAATYHYHRPSATSPLSPTTSTPFNNAPDTPLTFWNQQLTRGAHTVYASTPHSVNPNTHPAVQSAIVGYSYSKSDSSSSPTNNTENGNAQIVDHISFGRHVDFSTPVTQYLKSPTKN